MHRRERYVRRGYLRRSRRFRIAQLLHVPIFPLPNVVLFPGTILPLHVFEPRYRRLVNDVLGGDRRFAVFLQRPTEGASTGEPPPFEVGCLGEIVRADALPDGRFDVLLLGVARLRLREVLTDVPYRVAEAALAPEVDGPEVEGEGAFRDLTRRYFRSVLRRPAGPEVDQEKLETLVNTAAANVQVEVIERQRLLESASVQERMARVAHLMTDGLELRRIARAARSNRPADPRLN